MQDEICRIKSLLKPEKEEESNTYDPNFLMMLYRIKTLRNKKQKKKKIISTKTYGTKDMLYSSKCFLRKKSI